jgi:xanthine/uracil permease
VSAAATAGSAQLRRRELSLLVGATLVALGAAALLQLSQTPTSR